MNLSTPNPFESQRSALADLVSNTTRNLVLFDDAHQVIAASPALTASGGPLETFGWALDPAINTDFAPVFRQYMAILQRPEGIEGLRVTIPFEHENRTWSARVDKTIYPLERGAVCLAEVEIGPDPEGGRGSATLERVPPRTDLFDPTIFRQAW